MTKSRKSGKATNQKYFNTQKRLVEVLSRKTQPVLREDIEGIKNIGSVPWNCMVNLLSSRGYYTQGKTGRARLSYSWNGTKPSEKITLAMQRAMNLDRMKYEQRKAQVTSMKEVAIETQQSKTLESRVDNLETNAIVNNTSIDNRLRRLEGTEQQVAQLKKAVDGMRPLFINVRDNYEGNWDDIRNNTAGVTKLWENIHRLERTIEDNDKTKPSLLSRVKFPAQRFWNTTPSFRYFVYYSLAWFTISAAALTYYNGLSWIL